MSARTDRSPARRALAISVICLLGGLVGFVASALASTTITIPGTTVTVEVKDDGTVDTSKLASQGLALPPGTAPPGNSYTLPAGWLQVAQAAGLVPGSSGATTSNPASTPTSPAATSTTSSGGATGVPTTPTSTTPAYVPPTSSSPIPGLSLPGLSPAATTATTAAAARSTSDRAATLLLVFIGGLLLAGVLGWALARAGGWEPAWWAARRHEAEEASWRASNGWADFRDWLRQPR